MEQVCHILEISRSVFYEWLNRKPSAREKNNIVLRKAIIELHNKSCNSLNQAWVGDITYIPTDEGWLYLAIVKDLCDKKIVSYAFSERIDTNLTISALNMAISRRKPGIGLIFHVQYASTNYREKLQSYHIRQRLSRKGDPYDNAVAENFFSCLKCELTHLKHYSSRVEAKLDIFAYIEAFYNNIRPYSAWGWISPNAFDKLLNNSYIA